MASGHVNRLRGLFVAGAFAVIRCLVPWILA